MARIHAIGWNIPAISVHAEWGTPTGTISSDARRSYHPMFSPHGLAIRNSVSTVINNYSAGTGLAAVNKQEAYESFWLRLRNLPSSATKIWRINGLVTSDDLYLELTTTGTLSVRHTAGGTLVGTISALSMDTWYRITVHWRYNTITSQPLPNPPYETDGLAEVTAYTAAGSVHSSVTFDTSTDGSLNTGLAQVTGGWNISTGTTFGAITSSNGAWFDIADYAIDDSEDPGPAYRTTLLSPIGPGTHSDWVGETATGSKSYVYRGTTSPNEGVTTATTGNKISYQMESFASRGITGTIKCVYLWFQGSGSAANARPFIIINGVETIFDGTGGTTDWPWPNGTTSGRRIAISGITATDVIEVGVRCQANATVNVSGIGLVVEHNTAEPAPSSASRKVLTGTYIGNGTDQVIDLAALYPTGAALFPDLLYIQPIPIANPGPCWWIENRSRAATAVSATSVGSMRSVRVTPGKLHVALGTSSTSFNTAGVLYKWFAIYDPQREMLLVEGFARDSGAVDPKTHILRTAAGAASSFTPASVFSIASPSGSSVTPVVSYRGPGHVGDLTSALSASSVPAANFIEAIGTGTLDIGTGGPSHNSMGQVLLAWRVPASGIKTVAMTSYVGDGAATRLIPVALDGQVPLWVVIVPHNTTAKGAFLSGDDNGRNWATTTSNSNMGLPGPDRVTVNSSYNTSSVTYDVFALAPGDPSDPPVAPAGPEFQPMMRRMLNLPNAENTTYDATLIEDAVQFGSGSVGLRTTICPASGVLKNLKIWLTTAPGVGVTRRFSVMVGGGLTPMEVDISGTATEGTYTGAIRVEAGQLVRIRTVCLGGAGASPGDCHIAVEFYGDNPAHSIYAANIGTSKSGRIRPWSGTHSTTVTQGQYAAAAGAITALYAASTFTSLGGAASLDLYVMLNGVRQDGTGGTVDTQLRIMSIGENAPLSRSFNCPIARGDFVQIEAVEVGSFTSTWVTVGIQFTAATPGESQGSGSPVSSLASSNEQFNSVAWGQNGAWFASESSGRLKAGITPFGVKDPVIAIATLPGAGRSRVFTFRLNGMDTLITLGIANDAPPTPDAAGNYVVMQTESVGLVGDDRPSVRHHDMGSIGTNTTVFWTFILDTSVPVIPPVVWEPEPPDPFPPAEDTIGATVGLLWFELYLPE